MGRIEQIEEINKYLGRLELKKDQFYKIKNENRKKKFLFALILISLIDLILLILLF